MGAIDKLKALPNTQKLILGLGGAGLLFAVLNRKAIVTNVTAAATGVVDTLLGVKDAAVWAQKLNGVIMKELPQLSAKARTIIIAHAAYESGWGQKAAAARGTNNIFNITAGSQWKGPIDVNVNGDLSFGVAECQRLGRPMTMQSNGKPACKIDQKWRKYASVNEAIRDYWSFLGEQNGGRYLPARNALVAGDVPMFGQMLFTAGYFTLPPAEYVASMTKVVATAARFLAVVV